MLNKFTSLIPKIISSKKLDTMSPDQLQEMNRTNREKLFEWQVKRLDREFKDVLSRGTVPAKKVKKILYRGADLHLKNFFSGDHYYTFASSAANHPEYRKIYVDFGHHPGKDRLAREAALHGVCVITGLYGSAANSVDVPILDHYKLNPHAKDFMAQFFNLVTEIFNNFSEQQNHFQHYRAIIAEEPNLFQEQIIAAFTLREV